MTRTADHRIHAARAGFTILELLAVIAIIAILGTIVTVNLVGAQDKARITKTKTDMNTIKGALDLYRGQHGAYPVALEALLADNTMTSIPKDAWNRDFKYWAPATYQGGTVEFLLFSAGRNNDDPADDIAVIPDQQ